MTNRELANQILDALLKTPNGWVTTNDVLTRCGLSLDSADRWPLIKMAKRLVSAGKIEKQGVGKFTWHIKVSTWDRDQPLSSGLLTDSNKTSTGASAFSEDNLLSFEANSETFAKKEELKALGCRYKPKEETKNGIATWFAPNKVAFAKAMELLGKQVTDKTAADSELDKLRAQLKTVQEALKVSSEEIIRLTEAGKSMGSKHLKVTVSTFEGQKLGTLENVVLPAQWKTVLDLASARRNILLVGPAGCGKTHLGKVVSDSLGLPFGSLPCTSGMSETHLLGRGTPDFHKGKNNFQSTEFLRIYEGGGVFLLDEIDAADPNLLLCLNSALANGYCNVPNRPEKPVAKKHKDFICIATANTFGRGATRTYSGRNQLDEATLDRFRIGTVECEYDKAVEVVLCPSDNLRHRLQSIREKVVANGIRRIVSTRFLEDAQIMVDVRKWSVDKCVEQLLQGWTEDEKRKVA